MPAFPPRGEPIPIFPKWNAKKSLPVNSPVPEPNLHDLVARPLHQAGIRYLVAGSVRLMHYSEPRPTLDIDTPFFVNRKDIPTILNCIRNPSTTARKLQSYFFGVGVGVGPGMPFEKSRFSRNSIASGESNSSPLTSFVRPLLNEAKVLADPAKP